MNPTDDSAPEAGRPETPADSADSAESAPVRRPPLLDNVRVILFRPHYAGNIGSIARVMRNFGVRKLTLVDPVADHQSIESRRLAVHAVSVLDEAVVTANLREAIQDSRLVLCTSGNVDGLYRQYHYGRPDEWFARMADIVADTEASIVFGPEPHGLSNDEILHCHGIVRILTEKNFSSLNLAQAVAVCLYELHRQAMNRAGAAVVPTRKIAAVEMQDRMFGKLREALEAVHFVWGPKADSLMHAIRHLIVRAGPSANEVSILFGLARQLKWFAQHGVAVAPETIDVASSEDGGPANKTVGG